MSKKIKNISILFLIIVNLLLFFGCNFNPSYDENGMRSANKSDNGIWLGPAWIYSDTATLEALLDYLYEHQINRLYINIGFIENVNSGQNSFKFNMSFNNNSINSDSQEINISDFQNIINFSETIRNYSNGMDSNFEIIGVINAGYKDNVLSASNKKEDLVNIISNTVNYLNKKELKANGGYILDGFQLDIEPISNLDTYREIINVVKKRLEKNQFLSVTIAKNEIKYAEKIVATNMSKGDEIALMAYDYNLPDEYSYKVEVSNNTLQLATVLSKEGVDTSIYLPLYHESIRHDEEIESIKSCLTGIMVAAKNDFVYNNFNRVIIYNEHGELFYEDEWHKKGFDDYRKYWLEGNLEKLDENLEEKDKQAVDDLLEDVTFSTSTCLLVDISGSMNEEWMGGIKIISSIESAEKLVNMVSQESEFVSTEDLVSVVSFSDSATVDINPTPKYGEIKAVLNNLVNYVGGETNIADALYKSINAFKGENSKRIAILLSDGVPTRGITSISEIIEGPILELKDNNIILYTIGFGDKDYSESINEELLSRIAEETGGSYYYATEIFDLSKIYIRLRHESKGTIIGSEEGFISQGEEKKLDPIEVTSDMGDLNITLSWPGSEIEMELVDPEGIVVSNKYPNSSINTEGNPNYYIISNPISGNWEASLYGSHIEQDHEPYEVIYSTSKLREAYTSNKLIILSLISLIAGAAVAIIIVVVVKKKKNNYFIRYKNIRLF